ncbi:hypothetical protein VF21_10066 [Pseudogymnoascus sp. 05NY08]|nr:hypothetical protein VF21_10066 [Pseudogymnoascus sp. 05NY08]
MHFDLKHRTFRVATAATRETWYIVMRLIVAPVLELDPSRRKRVEREAKSSSVERSLGPPCASCGLSYQARLLSGELFVERVEVENEPVFHAYGYGTNIEFEVSEGLQTIGRETRLRPREDSDDEADANSGRATAGGQSQPQIVRGERRSVGDAQEEWLLDPNSHPDGLYSDGLTQLATELNQKYELDHISSISVGQPQY